MKGKSTVVCRYIRPQNPPPTLKTLPEVARYVSSIPYLPNRTVFAVTCHLWSTSDQVLNVGAGDAVEHAILLCNYLQGMDYEAW
ncbi:Coiled-coil and C2 domain-containing protein 2A, partial [Kappamyces sp. JEL0680]